MSIPLDKASLRRDVLARRRALPDRAARSETIGQRFLAEFPPADYQTHLVYVSVRDEVETGWLLENALRMQGRIVVPYCLPGNQLGLFQLEAMQELHRGAYGIREPEERLREERIVRPEALDLVVMPGVAFDAHGNRLGYGKGYFDRLLAQLRPDCVRIALAFDCQLVEEIPAQSHDVPVNVILTETQRIDCHATG